MNLTDQSVDGWRKYSKPVIANVVDRVVARLTVCHSVTPNARVNRPPVDVRFNDRLGVRATALQFGLQRVAITIERLLKELDELGLLLQVLRSPKTEARI